MKSINKNFVLVDSSDLLTMQYLGVDTPKFIQKKIISETPLMFKTYVNTDKVKFSSKEEMEYFKKCSFILDNEKMSHLSLTELEQLKESILLDIKEMECKKLYIKLHNINEVIAVKTKLPKRRQKN